MRVTYPPHIKDYAKRLYLMIEDGVQKHTLSSITRAVTKKFTNEIKKLTNGKLNEIKHVTIRNWAREKDENGNTWGDYFKKEWQKQERQKAETGDVEVITGVKGEEVLFSQKALKKIEGLFPTVHSVLEGQVKRGHIRGYTLVQLYLGLLDKHNTISDLYGQTERSQFNTDEERIQIFINYPPEEQRYLFETVPGLKEHPRLKMIAAKVCKEEN